MSAPETEAGRRAMDAIGLMLDRADIYEMRDGSNAEDHFAGLVAAIEAEAIALTLHDHAEHDRKLIATERARIVAAVEGLLDPVRGHTCWTFHDKAAVLAIIEPPK